MFHACIRGCSVLGGCDLTGGKHHRHGRLREAAVGHQTSDAGYFLKKNEPPKEPGTSKSVQDVSGQLLQCCLYTCFCFS